MFKKLISFFLAICLVLSTTITSFATESNEVIMSNGYVFTVVEKNDFRVAVSTVDDDGIMYTAILDKENFETSIETYSSDSLSRTTNTQTYKVHISDYNYMEDENLSSEDITLEDENGILYNLDNNEKSRALVIPIGIAITAAALEALFIVGSAIVVAGLTYIIVEEVAAALKRQTQYYYYRAYLTKGFVWVSNGISTSVANQIVKNNDSKFGVFALSSSRARGICGTNPRGPEVDGNGGGYWPHYHHGTYSKTHVWFF